MDIRSVFVADLVAAVARIAPPELAAPWDNVGLQAGHPAEPVRRVMTCLELTGPTLQEAIERRADAVVAHHPLIFKPLGCIDLSQPVGALLAGLLRARIALVAAHTNLDAAEWSTNSVLCEASGLKVVCGEPQALGLIAELPEPLPADAWAARLKARLGLARVRLSGPADKLVCKIAVCTGAGGSAIARAALNADALLTGEINYHHAVEAAQRGLAVVEIGHFESEAIIAAPLAQRLGADPKLAGVDVFAASDDLQPFRWA